MLSLAELRPLDRRFMWSGQSSRLRLDRFLCSVELLAAFPLAEVSALPDHFRITRPSHGQRRWGLPGLPTSRWTSRGFGTKSSKETCEWWRSRDTFGPASDKLVTKLKDLRHHLFDLRRQIRAAQIEARDAALTRVRVLDRVEDSRPLTVDEERERKACQHKVAEVDLRIEMDWRQRSRLTWLSARDANTRFFHQTANGRRRQNCNRRLQIGERTFSDQSFIGQAVTDHFWEFYRRGPSNQWRWLAIGASVLSLNQQQKMIAPFSEDEVKVAIRGLNSEGAPRPDGILVFFYLE